MRVLLARLRARSRSWLASTLDRCGACCLRMGSACFRAAEAVDVPGEQLTPAQGERILAGVLARIEAEAAPPAPEPFADAFTVPKWTLLCRWQGFH